MRFFAREMNNCLSWILDRGFSVRADPDGIQEYPHSWAWSYATTAFNLDSRRSSSWSLNESNYDDSWMYRSHPEGKPKEDRVKAIVDSFDFVRVQRMMQAVDWSWSRGVPSLDEMHLHATRLLGDVFDSENPDMEISSGGFAAFRRNGLLVLEFVGEEQEE